MYIFFSFHFSNLDYCVLIHRIQIKNKNIDLKALYNVEQYVKSKGGEYFFKAL